MSDINRTSLKEKSSKSGWKIIAAVFGALLIIYLLGIIFFGTHFYFHTNIGGKNYSLRNKKSLKEEISKTPMDIDITLVGKDDRSLAFNSNDVGMSYKLDEEMLSVDANYIGAIKWPVYIFKSNNRPASAMVDYDVSKLMSFLSKQAIFKNHGAIAPESAYIGNYDQTSNTVTIVPEKEGTILDMKNTLAAFEEAFEDITVDSKELRIDLAETGCYKEPAVKADNEQLLQSLDKANEYLKAEVIYDLNDGSETVKGAEIARWLVTNKTEVELDPQLVRNYVEYLASTYDTYNRFFNFTCADGSVRTIRRYDYGWKIDVDGEVDQLISDIESGLHTEREPLYSSKGYIKGQNDIGGSYVEVNMTAQHLYLWVNGEITLEAPVVTGDMATDCATPMGIFGIKFKKEDTILRGPTWEDHVYYWMPFYQNYGMHDATWREEFGGDIFTNNGSHGCVNLPLDHAGVIYNTVAENYPVICYY